MKKYRFTIIISLILIVLIFAQLIVYNNQKKEDTQEIQEEQNEQINIIENIDEFYKFYSEVNISEEKLQKNIYKLVVENILTIADQTKDKSLLEIQQYYKDNKKAITAMGIESENDFVLIATEAKNALKQGESQISSVRLECKDDDLVEGFYRFYIIIECSDDIKLELVCYLDSTNDQNVRYASNSDIAQMFRDHNVGASQTEFLIKLNNFIDNIKAIHEGTSFQSLNKQAQFYDENKAAFESMGIYSGEDLQNIASQVNKNITWTNNVYNYYVIDLESYVQSDSYAQFNISFYYNYTEKITLTVNLAEMGNIVPGVKFTV